MARAGDTLTNQLDVEADRIQRLGYERVTVHELRAKAADVRAAQRLLDFSKRERRAKVDR